MIKNTMDYHKRLRPVIRHLERHMRHGLRVMAKITY